MPIETAEASEYRDHARLLDGGGALAGTADDYVHQWSTAGGVDLGSTPNPGPVTGLAFTGGATAQLLSTATDGGLRIVALATPLPSVGTVYNLNYSRDSSRLAVFSGQDHVGVQLWNTSNATDPVKMGPQFGALTSYGSNGGTGAINPAGTLVAAGTRTGMCELYDVSGSAPVATTPPFQCLTKNTLAESFAFSPNGQLLAAGGDDHTIRIIDVRDPAHPRQLAQVSGGDLMLGVAFSPDGRLLAGANVDKHVYLWNVADPARPSQVAVLGGFTNYVYAVAFSPDGRLLGGASSDDTARVWRLHSTDRPTLFAGPLLGATDYVVNLAFSPDSRTLATTSNDGAVRLYSMTGTPSDLPQSTLTNIGASVFSVAYRPDGVLLSAAGRSDAVSQWTTTPSAYAESLCPLVGTPITRAEWALYVPGAKYDPPCG